MYIIRQKSITYLLITSLMPSTKYFNLSVTPTSRDIRRSTFPLFNLSWMRNGLFRQSLNGTGKNGLYEIIHNILHCTSNGIATATMKVHHIAISLYPFPSPGLTHTISVKTSVILFLVPSPVPVPFKLCLNKPYVSTSLFKVHISDDSSVHS